MFDDQKRYIFLIHITLDVICLIFIFSFLIPFLDKVFTFFTIDFLPPVFFEKGSLGTAWQLIVAPAFIAFAILILFFGGIYQKTSVQSMQVIFHHTIKPCILIAGIFFLINLFFSPDLEKIAVVSLSIGVTLWILLAINRLYIAHIIANEDHHQNIIKHILLAGTGEQAEKISNYIFLHPECGLRVVGFLTNRADEVGREKSGRIILGMVQDIQDIVFNHYTDCVLFAGETEYSWDIDLLIKSCAMMGIDFATTDPSLHAGLKNMAHRFTEQINGIPVFISKFVYRPAEIIFLKRAIDFTASLVLIFLCLPLFIPIAIAVKTSSPGPVLYRQKRIGKYGRKFILYKFRSMVVNAEKLQENLMHLNEMDGPVFKIKHDPRETRTGRFLRKTALDELPQLLNVFKGDISLVGPRPALEKEVIQYRLGERKRLAVIQGITCTWQVNGRNEISFHEWMKLDQKYIQNWSFGIDLIILMKTFTSVSSMILGAVKKSFQ